jgi:hypothetical protein
MVELKKDANSLQMSPNWFLGIWDPGPHPKWALVSWRRLGEKGFLSVHQENKNDFRKEWIRISIP